MNLYRLIICLFVIMISSVLYAGSEVTFTSTVGVTLPSAATDPLTDEFDKILDDNIGNIANGNFFANSTGYPIGTAKMDLFPHFFAGYCVGAAGTNLSYFDDERKEDGKFPGGGITGAFLFGTGITEKIDVIGKFLYYDYVMYDPTSSSAGKKFPLDLNELSLFVLGGKVRYNQVGQRKIIPFLFELQGITFSAGADLMSGTIGVKGEKEKKFDLGSQTFDPDGTGGVAEQTIDVYMEITKYDAEIKWFQLSTTASAFAYFDIIKIFTFYTGLSATVGYGFFTLNSEIEGTMNTDNTVFQTAAGMSDSVMGTATMETKSRYSPYPWLPAFTMGAEINLFLLKITAETSVNLKNKEDITGVIGMRFQI